MNRIFLLSAAATGLLCVGFAAIGCQHEESSTPSASSKSSDSTYKSSQAQASAADEPSVQASGQPGVHNGTGTTASGQVTGNATTGGQNSSPGSVNASASASPTPNPSASTTDNTTASSSSSSSSAAPSAGASASANVPAEAPSASASAAANPSAANPSAANQNQTGLGDTAQPAAAGEKAEHAHHHGMAIAVADVRPAAGAKDEKVSGTVKFMAADGGGVMAMIDLKGFKPDSKHGFHIHEKADLSSPDLKSAGGHFDPAMTKHHGGTEGDMRHGGDFGNITADENGNVKTDVTVHGISIDGEKDGIIGRSVIVHAKADDLKSQPAGDSGDRIAGGVIEKAKHEHSEKSEK